MTKSDTPLWFWTVSAAAESDLPQEDRGSEMRSLIFVHAVTLSFISIAHILKHVLLIVSLASCTDS